MAKLFLSLVIIASVGISNGGQIQTRQYYHIQSIDGSYLTIGGDNSGGVKVVTEDNHGTDPRQSFWVGAGQESHEISPQAQNTFSTLLIGIEMKSNLVFQMTRSIGARYQWWMMHDLGNNTWNVQNVRTGLCMSTMGKNTQVFGAVCDKSDKNQTWLYTFVPKLNLPVVLEH